MARNSKKAAAAVAETAEEAVSDTPMMTVSETDVAIEINHMNKWYGDFHVLKDINLRVMRGERIVVAGPSGSGKSSLINLLINQELPTSSFE